MGPRILLVNPSIHDFSAYDFWLKPYGLLQVAGQLRGKAELHLFDYLDRGHAFSPRDGLRSDLWGRGEFFSEETPRPACFSWVPRRYRRFGIPRRHFQDFLRGQGPFDLALVQTVMTYWYPGVKEVIEDIRSFSPKTKTVLGGVYATICPAHARSLGADLVVSGTDLEPLWRYLGVEPDRDGLPLWDSCSKLDVGVLKLADGCPFRCTYCSVPEVYPEFKGRPLERSLRELELLARLGAKNIVFYDDALLYRPERILAPFLEESLKRGINARFHTPNALNARFITKDLAKLMVVAGFKALYLGFESSSYEWQRRTGGKVYSEELPRAVENLTAAGADLKDMTAYLIVGHPRGGEQNVEESMRFAHGLGLRIMLSEFSPIPGTPDGESCREWVDLDEPLWHSKTVFPLVFLGGAEVNRLKALCHELNHRLNLSPTSPFSALTLGYNRTHERGYS